MAFRSILVLSGSVERAHSEPKDPLPQETDKAVEAKLGRIMSTDGCPTNMLEKRTLEAMLVRCHLMAHQ